MAALGVHKATQKVCTKPFLGKEHTEEASLRDMVCLIIPLV